MAPPYTPGQTLAWLDADPEGVRVHRATVLSIEQADQPERWTVSTERGLAIVDRAGVGAHAVALDTDIQTELYIRGDGYLVDPTHIELAHTLDQTSCLDLGDDLDIE